MTDLLAGGAAWWAIPATALAFGALLGFFPGFVLRLLILLYPPNDPRRRELIAELYVLGRIERIEWVFQQLETALSEGISARMARRRGPADENTGAAQGQPLPDEEERRAAPNRRPLLATTAVALTGGRPWVPARIGMTDVHQVVAANRALGELRHQYGGGFCRDGVIAQLP